MNWRRDFAQVEFKHESNQNKTHVNFHNLSTKTMVIGWTHVSDGRL